MDNTINIEPDFSDVAIEPFRALSDLSNPICREAFTYWDELRTDGRLDDFDLIAIPGAIPYVVVLEVLNNGTTMLVRMNGQLIVEASGHDHTGENLIEGDNEAPLTRKFCHAVLDHGTSVMSSDGFSATLVKKPVYFDETIGLPLYSNGGTLDRIVLVHGLGRDPSKEK